MKIRVVSTCHNEAVMLPFYLRHYCSFANEVEIYDDASTDGSQEIISGSSAKLLQYPGSGLDDTKIVAWFQSQKDRAAQDGVDWLVVPDIDEILYAPDGLRKVLESCSDYDVVHAMGWNMIGEQFPKDDGRQVWDIHPWGVHSGPYGKGIVCQPAAAFTWVPGRHAHVGNVRESPYLLKLLHYRFFGPDYTSTVNTRNFQRRAVAFNAQFTGIPNDGYGSPQWAHTLLSEIPVNALESKLQARE